PNRDLAPNIETVFMLTEASHVYVSSSLVKEIAENGGDYARYVPEVVRLELAARFAPEAAPAEAPPPPPHKAPKQAPEKAAEKTPPAPAKKAAKSGKAKPRRKAKRSGK